MISGVNRLAAFFQQPNVEWINVWRKVATDNAIPKGFKECGYIRYDGNTERLHSRLRDTMVNREVPPEVIKVKVNTTSKEQSHSSLKLIYWRL